ncbi:MAG: helix-turn-helix domain-containing protein [Saprospiraceae bacterium]|nr:helix-turn-helix domain-containing protein [Saprospiraceae bacterium]
MKTALVKLPELAKMLCCSNSTIYRYVRDQRISYIKPGRVILFKETDIEEFLNKNRISQNGR